MTTDCMYNSGMLHPNYPLLTTRIKDIIGDALYNRIIAERVTEIRIRLTGSKADIEKAYILLDNTGEFNFYMSDTSILPVSIDVVATLRGATNIPAYDHSAQPENLTSYLCVECDKWFTNKTPDQNICDYCGYCMEHCSCSLLIKESEFGVAAIEDVSQDDVVRAAGILERMILKSSPYYRERKQMLDALIGLGRFAKQSSEPFTSTAFERMAELFSETRDEIEQKEWQLERDFPRHS